MLLVYINFSSTVFTLFGGLNGTSVEFNRTLIESENFSQDWREILPKTGKKMLDVSGSGVVDPDVPKELFVRLLQATQDGTPLKIRMIRESDNLTIEGDFLISSYSLNDAVDTSLNFSITLNSTGQVTFS